MGKQDVRQALIAMDADEDVRERLAAGDFDAVEGLDLSPDEQTLVQDAANDMPEVSGFSFNMLVKLDGVDGESTDDKHRGEIELSQLGNSSAKWQRAVKYSFKFW